MAITAVASADDNFDVERAVEEYRRGYTNALHRSNSAIKLPTLALNTLASPLGKMAQALGALAARRG